MSRALDELHARNAFVMSRQFSSLHSLGTNAGLRWVMYPAVSARIHYTDELDTLLNWCQESFKGDWVWSVKNTINMDLIVEVRIVNEEDKAIFLMRWAS